MDWMPKSTVRAIAVGAGATRPDGASPLTLCSVGERRSRSASHTHSGTATASSTPHTPRPACHEPVASVTGEPADGPRRTLAQAINATLAELLEEHGETLVFGEDVAVKGGVYETFSGAAGRSEDDYRARLARQIPARRFGTPEDVAAAAVYLASEGASFVTGEALNVTGGQEMH